MTHFFTSILVWESSQVTQWIDGWRILDIYPVTESQIKLASTALAPVWWRATGSSAVYLMYTTMINWPICFFIYLRYLYCNYVASSRAQRMCKPVRKFNSSSCCNVFIFWRRIQETWKQTQNEHKHKAGWCNGNTLGRNLVVFMIPVLKDLRNICCYYLRFIICYKLYNVWFVKIWSVFIS